MCVCVYVRVYVCIYERARACVCECRGRELTERGEFSNGLVMLGKCLKGFVN